MLGVLYSLLNEIKPIIRQKIDVHKKDMKCLKMTRKEDDSLVTELDFFISQLFKEKLGDAFPNIHFYSEEDQGIFKFPIFVLDPIDGTKEFIAGSNEWVVSFGVYFSKEINDRRNFSWIFNPLTGLEVSSKDEILKERSLTKDKIYISKTEFQDGLFDSSVFIHQLEPVGSIAYKLALLSQGHCKAVISKRPKHIWDILAGTHICEGYGIFLYQNGVKVSDITNNLYSPDLVWSKSEFINEFFS